MFYFSLFFSLSLYGTLIYEKRFRAEPILEGTNPVLSQT